MSESLTRWLRSRRVRRNALFLLLWVGIFSGLFVLREVLLPFILATLIAYVIEPLVRWLASKKIGGRLVPRFAAVIGIYVGIAATVWLIAAFFVPQIYREVARLAKDGAAFVNSLDEAEIDRLVNRAEDTLRSLRLPIDLVTGAPVSDSLSPAPSAPANPKHPEEIFSLPRLGATEAGLANANNASDDKHKTDKASSASQTQLPLFTINLRQVAKDGVKGATALMTRKTAEIFSQVRAIIEGIASLLFSFVVVLMLTAFILMDTERIKRFFFSIVPVEDRTTYDALLQRIDRGLSGVVRGQLTICLVNGALTLVGLLILDVKFAFLLASLAAVFSLVPVFGSIMSTIPIVLVAVTSGFWTALFAMIWILFIHFVEANILNPKILGDSARIHPVMVVLALVAGEHFFGIAGALLAVPVMSILLSLFRFLQNRADKIDAGVELQPRMRVRPKVRMREPLSGG